MGVIKFSSPTCGPCMVVETKLNKANIAHESIDVTQHPEVIEQYNIKTVPTVIRTDENGNEINRLVGGDCINKLNEL